MENAQPFHYNVGVAKDNAGTNLLTTFQKKKKTFIYKTFCGPGLPYETSLRAHLDIENSLGARGL